MSRKKELAPKLDAAAQQVLERLRAQQRATNGPARITVRELAMLTSLEISSVRDCLADLLQAGLIRSKGVDAMRVPSWEVVP